MATLNESTPRKLIQSIDPPLSRGYTLGSGEDSMKLIGIDNIFPKFAETHNVVAFLEKPKESDGFAEIIDFLKASSVSYALTVNPVIYTSCIKKFSHCQDTMMVHPVKEMGEDSDHPTDSSQIPIIDQPSSSSQPKKRQPSKKIQRQEAEVPQDEAEHEKRELSPLKNRKVWVFLKMHPKGRSIEDIDADVEVTLVNEQQNEDLMFDTGVLDDDEVFVDVTSSEKNEQTTKIDDSTAGEAKVLAQTIIEIKALNLEAQGMFSMISGRAADGSSKRYSSMIRMLQGIDREDLEALWRIVKAKHGNTRPEDEFERVLYGDLKVMFKPDKTSEVWIKLQGYRVTTWKLIDSSGVHFVRNRSRFGINISATNLKESILSSVSFVSGYFLSSSSSEFASNIILKSLQRTRSTPSGVVVSNLFITRLYNSIRSSLSNLVTISEKVSSEKLLVALPLQDQHQSFVF
ncbi:hypothetical protein Tco_0143542 [Tanacetum coccineum]